MKKKILSGIMVLAVTMSVGMAVVAAEDSSVAQSGLQSKGAIQFSQGEDQVVIDSADIYKLAERLNQFKVETVDQLERMHTYLTKTDSGIPLTETESVYVAHSEPGEDERVDPLSLDLGAVLQSVALSQSVTADPTAYGESSDTVFYQTIDGRLDTTSSQGAKSVDIRPATADNLSAGAVAWVDGGLLLGTGADVADASGKDEPLVEHDIASSYSMPEDVKTAFAYLSATGSGGTNAASTPSLSLSGGGTYHKLYEHSYSRSGYNVKIALYYLKNIPKGAKVEGNNGLLFY